LNKHLIGLTRQQQYLKHLAILAIASLCIVALFGSAGCKKERGRTCRELPKESYEREAVKPATPDDYVIKMDQMKTFYDVPGEFGHILIGKDHGFKSLSFIVTDTQPAGGPPLHTHDTEEAHVLLEGRVKYWIEDPVTHERKVFTVEGPYVVRVPAGFQHTFINAGDEPVNLIVVLPDEKLSYHEVGKNPLVGK
jgi:mannose-6-phosphate isomerase-like protein (cupin superfamily)